MKKILIASLFITTFSHSGIDVPPPTYNEAMGIQSEREINLYDNEDIKESIRLKNKVDDLRTKVSSYRTSHLFLAASVACSALAFYLKNDDDSSMLRNIFNIMSVPTMYLSYKTFKKAKKLKLNKDRSNQVQLNLSEDQINKLKLELNKLKKKDAIFKSGSTYMNYASYCAVIMILNVIVRCARSAVKMSDRNQGIHKLHEQGYINEDIHDSFSESDIKEIYKRLYIHDSVNDIAYWAMIVNLVLAESKFFKADLL